MSDRKWLAPILPYLAVWVGLFYFKSAWTALLVFHAAILFVLVIARPNLPIESLLKSKSPKWIVLSALACSISGIGLYFFWNVFGISPELPGQLRAIGLNSSTWVGFIAYFSLVNPAVEEYFWRGFLGNNSARPVIDDVIFAGYHALVLWGKLPLLLIFFILLMLSLAGWFWRQVSRLDEGLLAAVLGHAVADFSIMSVVFWMCH
jgi:hypothetical protein